jgi:hypothetical protein
MWPEIKVSAPGVGIYSTAFDVDADLAVLSHGPLSGIVIVTAGAANLLGAEFGVGE